MNDIGRLAVMAVFFFSTGHSVLAKKKPVPEQSVADIADAVRPSLVKVIQVGREGVGGLGSGFVVRSDGLIATNRHVIGEARRIKVEMSDGAVEDVTEIFASDVHLDLAILRIGKQGLKPLPLGDSAALRQGDQIVAMGNPVGLANSVVEGVISEPRRDVEGIAMIQVALPIERGNSGGPLLDRQGRVLGLLTLKSALTANLGFAMPVNELKKLIEKPNPVPMSRWLTIGALNPRVWKPLMGAQWTQRAGTVNVEQPGDGFGGRSLCLWMAEEPAKQFDATVTVRLDDESGAAGLAFCADGGDRHYGFYPTGGKLRLTRFDGADIFSWKILADSGSDAYRPGQWNTLRVRVDEGHIKCFVNGREVFDQEDQELRGGHAGLCKFRGTNATYKGFAIGKDLTEKAPDPALANSFRKSMNGVLEGKIAKDTAMDALLKNPAIARRILTEQRKALEQNAATLDEMERELHRRAVVAELVRQLSVPDGTIDLLRCALLVSKHDNPELDVESYMRGFAALADELRKDPEIKKDTHSAVRRLTKYLFEENGFHGSRQDYESRSNSYINEVLDDREGLPITLSVVFLEVAKRIGIKNVAGIPLPMRFMIGYREKPDDEFSLLDVYEGGKELTMEQGKALVAADAPIPAEMTRPAPEKEIILRMIRNLIPRALASQSAAKVAAPYLDLVLAIEPGAFRERLNRARLREISGDKSAAAKDVAWVLDHPPQELDDTQRALLEEWRGALLR